LWLRLIGKRTRVNNSRHLPVWGELFTRPDCGFV
jgi:hypothetical protein